MVTATNAPKKAKKSKKQRKMGRNTVFCKIYALSHRREHNAVKRLRKHLNRFPGDNCAKRALDDCKAVIRAV